MEVFTPKDYYSLIQVIISVGLLIFLGYFLFMLKGKALSRLLCWSLGIGLTFLAHYLNKDEAAGYRMLAIILTMFISMKVVVTNEYFIKGKKLSWLQWVAFAIGWFGMNPHVFSGKTLNKQQQGKSLIAFGASRMILGLLFCFIAWVIAHSDSFPVGLQLTLSTIFLLIGLSLILHFGLLNINSGLWNLLGVGTYKLFRAPLRSLSLSEFWGKRWNIAFSEMASIAVYRPLSAITSDNTAKLAAFAFSGLLHELAISVPVNKGYGLPSLYFLLHAIAIFMENKIGFKTIIMKRAWVIFWLVAPLPLLFHRYFLEEIIWPIIGLSS